MSCVLCFSPGSRSFWLGKMVTSWHGSIIFWAKLDPRSGYAVEAQGCLSSGPTFTYDLAALLMAMGCAAWLSGLLVALLPWTLSAAWVSLSELQGGDAICCFRIQQNSRNEKPKQVHLLGSHFFSTLLFGACPKERYPQATCLQIRQIILRLLAETF